MTFYADTPEKLDRLVGALNRSADRGEPAGYDSEFYALDIRKQSTVARAKIHLMSVAVLRYPYVIHPRGYRVSDPAVLPALALSHRGFRLWLEHSATKAVHNLPVDQHALGNHGVALGGGVNTLALARWAFPERARGAGFTLDSLGQDLIGAGKLGTFSDIFSEDRVEYTVTSRKDKACECGARPCKMRSTTQGHTRIESRIETRKPKTVTYPIPLESVVPGHPRWERALVYAAQDAVLALAVYDLAMNTIARRKVEVPW